ncbi:phosphohydrolase [Halobacteriales archaeon QH_2_65_14]|nr:MAG: phosphohydrolase [Halobacteriales archaeon QH_2_65_14]
MELDDIRSTARSYFDEEMSPAHDWHHVQRVEGLAETLLDRYEQADGRVVRLAVLLHDVGRAREDRGDAVCHAIRVHRYSTDREPETIEAEILCDADNLDALGAVGVARCFTYGGELGTTIHDPHLPPEDDDTPAGETQYNHFHKKILRLPDRMYTDRGRELAADRRAFVETFLDRFDREVAGER